MTCAFNNELTTLEIEKGYYRYTNKSKKVYVCPFEDACKGGNGTGGDGGKPNYW